MSTADSFTQPTVLEGELENTVNLNMAVCLDNEIACPVRMIPVQ